jgi:beta-phosphoglucomutase
MAKRGTVEEADASCMPAIILSGVYDKHGNMWREPVNAPDPLFTVLSLDGVPFSLASENLSAHSQSLDFHYGVYSRKTTWNVKGARLTVSTERFASMDDVHLLCMKYTVSADVPISPKVEIHINTNVHDLNGPHLGHFQFALKGQTHTLICETLEKKIPIALANAIESASPSSIEENHSSYLLNLDDSKPAELFVFSAIWTGLDTDDPLANVEKSVLHAKKAGWDRLLAEHKAKWDEIWQIGDVVIKGDDYAQKALRYSLYHLHIIAPRHKRRCGNFSIPARGLSGQTYKGAIFWDTEMFMAPYFLATEPELAAQFIRYRIETLPGARRKAREYGFRGAFFAWESQETGDDACTDFNVTDVFTGRPVRTYFRDKQVHISADIALAVKRYVDATGDFSILKEGGLELVLEVARFYLSSIYYSPEHKRYEALDVVGPDEYHERVNNNAFTNRMILMVFETALTTISLLKERDEAFIEELMAKLNFSEDFAFMQDVMPRFYVPQPNEQGVIEQFDGYFRLEDCSLDAVRSRLKDPKEYWGGGNGVASTTRIIKQADVVTMLALFGDEYPAFVKKANLAFYEPRTEHGSSLSACMYALLACETGDSDWAYPFFIKNVEIDITGKGKHFAGLVYIGGTHPAANGGAWLTVIHGFCGFSLKNNKIQVRPRLPSHWEEVMFHVSLPDGLHKVTVTRDGWNEEVMIQVNMKGAIFDLDGVIVDTAKYHFLAWKRLAAELGFDFTQADNERLKGVSRMRSLDILLDVGRCTMNDEEKKAAASKKNAWYMEYLGTLKQSDMLPGALEYLSCLKKQGIRIALGSASKNAGFILEKLGICGLFDAVIDGNAVSAAKPDPEVFLKAASALSLSPSVCTVFEDSLVGIQAAKAGGMKVVGVGSPELLPGADMYVSCLRAMHPSGVRQLHTGCY